MPETQDVNCAVTVGSIDLSPTDVEVEITGSPVANSAVVKGYLDDPTDLSLNDTVSVESNGQLLFTGRMKNAKQHEDGEVTMEAYGTFADINRSFVKLHTEQPRHLNEIARDILADFSDSEYGSDRTVPRTADPRVVDVNSIYVAPGREFPSGDTRTHKQWGSGSGGVPLLNALEDLSDGLGGVLWSDRRNVLRLEPAPQQRFVYRPTLILSGSVGSDETTSTDTVESVLVESSSGAVGEDAAQQYIESKISNKSHSGSGFRPGVNVEDEIIHSQYRKRDDNVVTQQELNVAAASGAINATIQKESGTLTLVGVADPSPYDNIEIIEESNIPLAEGEYTIGSVTHTINESDGWETELSLRPQVSESALSISDATGIAAQIAGIFSGALEPAEALELTENE